MKIYIITGEKSHKKSVYCNHIFVKTKKMTDFFLAFLLLHFLTLKSKPVV